MGNFLGARSLFVDTAGGFNLVSLSYASFGQNLYVWLGGDSDQATVYPVSAKTLSVDAGIGYDVIQYSAADHLFTVMGDGDDWMAVTGSQARASALFDGGAGELTRQSADWFDAVELRVGRRLTSANGERPSRGWRSLTFLRMPKRYTPGASS